MSHILEARTEIEQPDEMLLRQAVEAVAASHKGGQIKTHYLDYYGTAHKTPLAIFTDQLRRGMAITTVDGKLAFVGDYWRVQDLYEQIQREVVQTYVSLATLAALREMGYDAQVTGTEQEVVIQGRLYA